MSTNIESWAGNVTEIGPLYPFAGAEPVMWIIGLAFWIIWAVLQDREETRQYKQDVEYYTRPHSPPG